MKTYRNEECGFEIDIPEHWSFHSEGKDKRSSLGEHSFIFKGSSNEAFNIQVGPLMAKSSLEQTETLFKQYAHKKGYTSLGLGRLTVGGREHVWARYYMGGGLWSKKYMIVLNGVEYDLTTTCLEQKYLLEMEKSWDKIAESFRLIKSNPFDLNKTLQMLATPARLSEIPKLLELCQQALAYVDRQTDPEIWAGLEIELAKNLGQTPLGDRAENIEQAIFHNQKALEICTLSAYRNIGRIFILIWRPIIETAFAVRMTKISNLL